MMGTDDLNSHLPAALRFARGLTRSKREGEALVETTLRSLLEGSARLDRDLPLPAAVFECIYRSWIPVDAPHGRRQATARDDGIDGALSRVAPRDRAPLLLVRFEGLSPAEAARVLHVTEAEIQRRLTRAERRLLRQPHPRVMIIGEDAAAAADLQDLVSGLDCEVVGPVAPRGAVSLAASQSPDLIVVAPGPAADRPGVEAVEAICRHRDTPVIFVTNAPELVPGRQIARRRFVTGPPLDREAAVAHIHQALGRTPVE